MKVLVQAALIGSNIAELCKLHDFDLVSEAYQLTPEQQQRVSKAKAEYLAGNVLSEQQADEAIDLYLVDNSLDSKDNEESVIKYQL